jgi:hypothetical protein
MRSHARVEHCSLADWGWTAAAADKARVTGEVFAIHILVFGVECGENNEGNCVVILPRQGVQ